MYVGRTYPPNAGFCAFEFPVCARFPKESPDSCPPNVSKMFPCAGFAAAPKGGGEATGLAPPNPPKPFGLPKVAPPPKVGLAPKAGDPPKTGLAPNPPGVVVCCCGACGEPKPVWATDPPPPWPNPPPKPP